jgi:hypothetical protein
MRRSSRAFQYICVPSLLLCVALAALAKDGRDFAGFYAISNVHDLSDPQDKSLGAERTAKVELTLTVQLFNYSDLGDIKTPVVALLEAGSHVKIGEFSAVKTMPANHDVIVSGQFTVSKMEFQSWSKHGMPQVVVIYEDSGRTLRQHAQLSRRLMLPPATVE